MGCTEFLSCVGASLFEIRGYHRTSHRQPVERLHTGRNAHLVLDQLIRQCHSGSQGRDGSSAT